MFFSIKGPKNRVLYGLTKTQNSNLGIEPTMNVVPIIFHPFRIFIRQFSNTKLPFKRVIEFGDFPYSKLATYESFQSRV